MPTKRFRNKRIGDDRMRMIEQAQEILSEYDTKLTARQLYYQFVARDLIPNTPRSYQNLTTLITDARYAGLIDWDAIEDRGREPSIPLQFENLRERVDSALANYRLPRWEDQPYYAELWVEKQALAGVLAPLARDYHVPLMVNKGYSSASAMYESAMRIRAATGFAGDWWPDFEERINNDEELQINDSGSPEYERVMDRYRKEIVTETKESFIFYLGDHDPSGEDMVRDISDRLKEFGVMRLQVRKLALTMQQIRRFNPPPNPAKLTDSRAKEYIKKFGNESWEVDALPPRELTRIIREAFVSVIDREKMNDVIDRENRDKETLRQLLEGVE